MTTAIPKIESRAARDEATGGQRPELTPRDARDAEPGKRMAPPELGTDTRRSGAPQHRLTYGSDHTLYQKMF